MPPRPGPPPPAVARRTASLTLQLGPGLLFSMEGDLEDIRALLTLWLTHLPTDTTHTQAVLDHQTDTLNAANGRLQAALTAKGT